MDEAPINVPISVDTTEFDKALKNMTISSQSFGRAFSSEIQRSIRTGRSFDETLKSLALRLSDMALQAGLKPLESLTSNILGSVVSSIGSAVSGGGSGVGANPFAGSPGVRAASTAQVAAAQPMNVVFNVATPDVQGFKKSEGQMSAMLARSVGRARRAL